MRCLLEYGANPTLRFDGFSASDVARDDGNVTLVRLLCRAEATWREQHVGVEDEEEEDEEAGEDGEDSDEQEEDSEQEPEDEEGGSDSGGRRELAKR